MNTSVCHLCVTHSPLVTMVFRAAGACAGLTPESTGYIARRGIPFPGNGLCLDDLSDLLQACYKKCDRRGYKQAREELDRVLTKLTGGVGFYAYLPHTNKLLYQEIINDPKCLGYYFLEEGFTSMSWESNQQAGASLLKVIQNTLRSLWVGASYRFSRPMFDCDSPGFLGAYGISESGFRGMHGARNVFANLDGLPAGKPPGVTYVILDACYIHRGVRWQAVEDALINCIHTCVGQDSDIYAKFHFADSDPSRRFDSICARLKSSGYGKITLLDASFAVEEHLTREDLLLFGMTSLGYYAALLGGRTKCFANEIQGVSIPGWIAKGWLPDDFISVARLISTEPH